jgi:hypothetical protein
VLWRKKNPSNENLYLSNYLPHGNLEFETNGVPAGRFEADGDFVAQHNLILKEVVQETAVQPSTFLFADPTTFQVKQWDINQSINPWNVYNIGVTLNHGEKFVLIDATKFSNGQQNIFVSLPNPPDYGLPTPVPEGYEITVKFINVNYATAGLKFLRFRTQLTNLNPIYFYDYSITSGVNQFQYSNNINNLSTFRLKLKKIDTKWYWISLN